MGYISGRTRISLTGCWKLSTILLVKTIRFLAAFGDKLDLGALFFQHMTPADR
jgi:hypothetical protein